MTQLIWLHEDHLSIAENAKNETYAFFVWDDLYLKKMNYGFKRLVFIYETLCEMDVDIYRGSTIDVIDQIRKKYSTDTIGVYETPNPDLQRFIVEMKERCHVEIIKPQAFVKLDEQPDLKRFFRYWNKAKKKAMTHDGGV